MAGVLFAKPVLLVIIIHIGQDLFGIYLARHSNPVCVRPLRCDTTARLFYRDNQARH